MYTDTNKSFVESYTFHEHNLMFFDGSGTYELNIHLVLVMCDPSMIVRAIRDLLQQIGAGKDLKVVRYQNVSASYAGRT